MRLAAIDIGSNAARLLIVEVQKKSTSPKFIKLNLIRIPLRLGFDVFTTGKIGRNKRAMLMHMMQAFHELMNLYQVDAFKAYATSAMRNAQNSDSIIREINKKTGIKIKIINGKKEAELLFQTHAAEKLKKKNSYLYVNVGGGSTELNLFSGGKTVEDFSVEIGTIRLLKEKITSEQWRNFQAIIKSLASKRKLAAIIGTGGNINKVASLTNHKSDQPLTFNKVNQLYYQLKKLTTAQRITRYNLKEDRADVIVPALKIYLEVMKSTGTKAIYVPKVGLVDGIIYSLYTQLTHKKR